MVSFDAPMSLAEEARMDEESFNDFLRSSGGIEPESFDEVPSTSSDNIQTAETSSSTSPSPAVVLVDSQSSQSVVHQTYTSSAKHYCQCVNHSTIHHFGYTSADQRCGKSEFEQGKSIFRSQKGLGHFLGKKIGRKTHL